MVRKRPVPEVGVMRCFEEAFTTGIWHGQDLQAKGGMRANACR